MTVPFHHLDPLNMVWHGNYLKYFDIARTALFDKLGIDLHGFYLKTKCIFPLTRTSTKHINSLVNRDEFICKATVVEATYKIVIDFEIRLAANGKICTRGRSEQVAVKTPEMEMLLHIPDEIRIPLGF